MPVMVLLPNGGSMVTVTTFDVLVHEPLETIRLYFFTPAVDGGVNAAPV
jgi:hypothetical protein